MITFTQINKGMIKMKLAVHFGAGNIGRGFIGALFSQSGYHVTFVDIADQVINQLNEEKHYQVKLATDQQESMTIENVSGLNNMTQEQRGSRCDWQGSLSHNGHWAQYSAAYCPVNGKGNYRKSKEYR